MRASRSVAALGLGALALGLVGCVAALSRHRVGNSSVPDPAKAVDLQRYLGRWYEIARYEQRFERGCHDVTADYALLPSGSISVVNRCRKPGGKISEARGRARVVDRATSAKLKVSFFGPFWGDYWILDHADDYSWSIVGEPSGRYLWILARAPRPPETLVRKLIQRTESMGYDTSMLLRTRQD